MQDPGDLVEVESFAYAGAARVAEGLLRSEGIPCVLRDQGGFAVGTLWDNNTSALRLLVPAEYAEQARELLNSKVEGDEAL